MKNAINKLSTKQLHIFLHNYQRTLLRVNEVLSESTKLLGNDKIAEIINELRKRESKNA